MRAKLCAVVSVVLLTAACGGADKGAAGSKEGAATASATSAADPQGADAGAAANAGAPKTPLRPGERFLDVSMPTAYTPKAPNTTGTDDYRCFLLDPKVAQDSFITGINILPGSPKVVHHVILFQVPPESVKNAEAQDNLQGGEGWTCFGGTGLGNPAGGLDEAPWVGAWAPGGGESTLAPDLGIPLQKGSRIVMQVHYNLLAGHAPDTSSARLRIAPGTKNLKPLETILLPGPVELPCRPGHTGPLCDRAKAVADVQERFGLITGQTGNYLNVLCPGNTAGLTQFCTRPVRQAGTIRAVAGHMHLLGRTITVTVNKGRPDAKTVLNIPVWDFDNQGSIPLKPPVKIKPGDSLTVTCTHDQKLRDIQPAFQSQPERYVIWGEGTTDEMCLGIVLVTRP